MLAVAVAFFLRNGNLATLFGMIAGTAFMWMGKPPPPIDTGDDD